MRLGKSFIKVLKLSLLKYFENLEKKHTGPEPESQYNSNATNNTTYTTRHVYQDSCYQCCTSTEKSNQTPNTASGEFVRLVKIQTENITAIEKEGIVHNAS